MHGWAFSEECWFTFGPMGGVIFRAWRKSGAYLQEIAPKDIIGYIVRGREAAAADQT